MTRAQGESPTHTTQDGANRRLCAPRIQNARYRLTIVGRKDGATYLAPFSLKKYFKTGGG